MLISRRHTMAYVCGSGRLYCFGSGANGQLGNGKSEVMNLPVPVDGPFVANQKQLSTQKESFVINRIAAGGDFCCVWATKPEVG